MDVTEILDTSSRMRIYRVWDQKVEEELLIIVEEGELRFYQQINPDIDGAKQK